MVNLPSLDVAFNTQVLVTIRGRAALPIYIYSHGLLSERGRHRLYRAFILGFEDFGSVLYVLHLFDNNILITVVIFGVKGTSVPMVIVKTKSHEILSSSSVRLELRSLLPLRRNILSALCFSNNKAILISDFLRYPRQSFLLDRILNARKIPLHWRQLFLRLLL